jgi:hypothetical protein
MLVTERNDEGMQAGTCAYCLWRFTEDDAPQITSCVSCSTPYHADCFRENGGCATFGCPDWAARQGAVVAQPAPAPSLESLGAHAAGTGSTPVTVPAPPAAGFGAMVQASSGPAVRPNFCDQCGTGIGPSYVFCSGCGRRI